MDWKLKRTKQCAKCPWRIDVDPNEIPNGYSQDAHCALGSTIAKEGDLRSAFATEQRVMACHENHKAHCIGWLMNQLGPGNNIGLRIRMRTCVNAGEIKLAGEQHRTFEETLPSAKSDKSVE